MAFNEQFKKMKNIFVPHIKQIPQWKQIYFDIQTLEMLSHICHKSNELIKNIRRKIQAYEKSINHKKKTQRQIRQISKIQKLCRCEFKLNLIIQESSSRFYKYCQQNISLLFHFIQYKCHLTTQKLLRITHYSHVVQRSNPTFITLIQNLYIQVHYILLLIKHNKSTLQTTKSLYQLNLYSYQLLDGSDGMRKVNRLEQVFDQAMEKLTRIYRIKREKFDRTDTIQQILNKPNNKTVLDQHYTFILGFSMGFLIVIFAAMNFFETYHDITIEKNAKFASDFPIWRGASSFVFYSWILGFCILFMEKMNINYKMIVAVQDQTLPPAKSLLLDAQVSTTVLLILFIVYMLKMGGVINISFNYFGHLMWLFLILYYLVPFPFTNYMKKIYFLKLLGRVIISPFTRCTGLIVFISQQIISFNQPYTDLVYTVCKLNNYQSKCKQAPDYGFAILVVLFLYRITQNTRRVQQAGWKKIPPFYGLFRGSSGLIVTVVSFFYRMHLTSGWLAIWVITAAFSTTIAIWVDFKVDWGLLDPGLLSRKLYFFDKKYVYYIFMVLDAILRSNWVFNVSPTLLTQFGIFPYYLVMIVTYLQLFRRGFWCVFRMEFQHSKNTQNFRAVCDDTSLETQLQQKYSNWLPHDQKSIVDKQVLTIRASTQLELVKTGIQNQIQRKATIRKTIQQFEERFDEIQDSLDNEIS